MNSGLKTFMRLTALILLFLMTVGFATGTAGGISDNIHFKDWYSVTAWAILGPLGFAMSGAGCCMIMGALLRRE